ncbi:Rab family GTPase [Arcobacter cloacae]|uniref:GTP-binding protein n=1 Tax=Arcobacter cloacae TaxID=1054034 RepID=A0A6M8NU67_9BACT|nr:Rab family GTPase [Arcobacter cloacae]QKF90136.1 Ras family small GTPase [Arcobacter cloacae]RXI37372.1 GTP-binding protein [Arcobacter cloacae]
MFNYKIVLVGDFGVGKTSLIKRYVDNSFSDEYKSSIGVAISKKLLSTLVNDKTYDSTMMIWDIEGKTDFKPILSHYLSGAKGFIIVADLTRENTINSIKEHIELCEKTASNLPICIAFNKSDLVDDEIELESFRNLSSNVIALFKTSAKDDNGVSELFEILNNEIIKRLV